jgi:hypothetical protein
MIMAMAGLMLLNEIFSFLMGPVMMDFFGFGVLYA